jgi:hypothetical protein
MRVVRPSGEVISEKPTLSQTSDVAASTTNPVYTQTKVVRYSLSNVAPGTLVDLSWTIETTNPALPGDMQSGWNVSLATPGMRSRFVLDVPASLTPHIVETHLDFKRTEEQRDGRHVYTWATSNLTPPKGEIFAPDSSIPNMSVRVTAPESWSTIGKWYNSLASDRYVLTPALVSEIDSIVRPATTRDDTLRHLHRWIANDLRYVSVSLGMGGYQPRFPAATVGTGYGDCKDKATLFIAAAKHFGVTVYPVLLNSAGAADRSLPAVEQFDHVIAALPHRNAPGYTFLDLTTFDFPDGEIPPSYQGGFGLVVHPDGSSEEVTFPKDSAGTTDEVFTGEMTSDGKVSGTFAYTALGSAATELRASFPEAPDSAQRDAIKRTAPKPFDGSVIDTVMLFDAHDRTAPATIRYVMHGGSGAKPAGPLSILSIPEAFRGPGTAFSSALDEMKQEGERHLPIDSRAIMGTGGTRNELRLTLPEGYTAQLPQSVNAVSEFGTFRAEYSQVGRELRIVHTVVRGTAVLPPSQLPALVAWFGAMAKDDAEYIPLTHGK